MSVEGLALGLIIFILIVLLVVISLVVLEIVGVWKVFKKAGKNGWEAIIPYYSTWTLVEISGCKWWFFLIVLISGLFTFNITIDINDTSSVSYNPLEFIGSILNLFGMFMINYNIAKKFNKDLGYAIGLTLLPFVFYSILGFGKSIFDKNVSVSPYGIIKEGDR